MQISYGLCAHHYQRKVTQPITWDSRTAVNGHCLIVGMSGAGKTFQLCKMIDQMRSSSSKPVRFHVFDVHGDIRIDSASSVLFSEQTRYGLNPLRVIPDPHYGGVRKSIQAFIATMNRVRALGTKQEAVLRSILNDIYARNGFKAKDPSTWYVNENEARLISDGSDGRMYLDVPIEEKDDAKSLGAKWDAGQKCWFVNISDYQGPIQRWPPKTTARSHPTLADALGMAKYILQKTFLGASVEAITHLQATNRAAAGMNRKLLKAHRLREARIDEADLSEEVEKAKKKAIDAYSNYVNSIQSGTELMDVLKYDSTEVLKSVINRLENLNATGIFKSTAPPFDPRLPVWRYELSPLSLEERKLFVLFRLQELFNNAVQRGPQDHISDVIILDEAHIYADDDPDNIINTIAKEARKFGVALICASQSPTHFTEDFIASVGTKVILGIDEMYWRASVTKMRVPESALQWIKLTKSMLVQVKRQNDTKNEWSMVLIPSMQSVSAPH
ncbi:DUF5710 domain-containing protein [Neopusillimonas maritima]|uniref:AAA+ ATPase domain-containing protein n=1 Tax=Neopusillimonas maritima TaxID=2026239 RepID=A0A3A1YUS1_9BURK|nr:DUF5710 domain-containing protein [Neopusillimonas maritima]RIY41029.1 hypothetical protein CJP73_07735 [Neopusillimonas maritima]